MRKYTIRGLIYSVIIFLFACKKDIPTPQLINDVGSSDNYPSEFLRNLLPIEGSCIDTVGNLLFFQFPFLNSPHNPVISAKILKAISINSNSTIFDFQSQTFSYGSYTGIQYNGQFGWVPNNGCASLAMTRNGRLYMSYSNTNKIYRIDNDSYYGQWSLSGVIAISAFKNTIYVATAPIYDGSFNISQLPRIYEIDSPVGIPNLYYEFPSTINFNNYSGGYSGGSTTFHPIVFSMSLKMDMDTSLYVAFGYDDVIYKIDKDKNLSTYTSSIPYPTSIDIAENGIMYVASAPGFTIDSTFNVTMNKPPQVYTVQQGIPNKIYEGSLFTPLYSSGNSTNDPLHRVGNSFYSISVISANKVYLVSPLEGKIVCIN